MFVKYKNISSYLCSLEKYYDFNFNDTTRKEK